MQIAVDAMGGDFAPRAAVEGAFRAAREGTSIVLVGDSKRIRAELARLGHRMLKDDEAVSSLPITIEHTDEVVAMADRPTVVLKKKKASVIVCADLVRQGHAQAMVTAGNTGAAMIAAKKVIGTIPGVDRPALAAVFPNQRGRTVVLDVGANVGARASHLRQFAVMGHFYAQEIVRTPSPRIGLMSIGEEKDKGTQVTREVFSVLQGTGLNFIGNVEGSDVFRGTTDVIVCDGFVGNVMLKSSEALASYIASMFRRELYENLWTRLGAMLIRPAFNRFRRRIDWSEYGAAPLLGVRGGCFIGHGRSNAKAVRNAIRSAVEFCTADLHNKIRDKVAELHTQEERLLSRELL